MALLTVQQAQVTGVALNLVAATGGGDTIRITGGTYLVVRNLDASSKTVTLVRAGNDEYGNAIPDVAVVVATGVTSVLGPIPSTFKDATDDLVDITYTAVTAVTVAAFRAG